MEPIEQALEGFLRGGFGWKEESIGWVESCFSPRGNSLLWPSVRHTRLLSIREVGGGRHSLTIVSHAAPKNI
jgi:hypothetical protein